MPLIHRLMAPGLIAALSLVSLAVSAGESTPVHFSPAVAAPAPAQQQARVIVKYKASAGGAKILSANAGAAGVPQRAQALGSRLGLTLVDGRGMDGNTQLVHASGISSAALAQRLAQDSSVEWAVPDRRVRAHMVPNDPLYASSQASPNPPEGQWYLHAVNASALPPILSPINAESAWNQTQGVGQVVAVLDTGITDHEDLAAQVLPGANMVSLNTSFDGTAAGKCITGNGQCRTNDSNNHHSPDDPGDWVSAVDVSAYPKLFNAGCVGDSSWHGTQVAGIVGAEAKNNLGISGTAPGVKILPVRVLGKCGGYDSDIIDGLRWAAGLSVTGVQSNTNRAQVVNMSLGCVSGPGVDCSCTAAYQSAIDEVVARGVVVVAAAGNDGLDVGAPANCKGVVAVAGVRQYGTKVGYSNLGPLVAISAPAGNCVNVDANGNLTGPCLFPIVTTINSGLTSPSSARNTYTDASNRISLGTSFATPQVAGVAALLLATRPALQPADVGSLIKSSARSFPSSGSPNGAGAGPNKSVLTCQAPSATPQLNECYCTTQTCGAGLIDASAAVMAAPGYAAAHISGNPSNPVAGQTITLDASSSLVPAGRSVAGYAWAVTSGSTITTNASSPNASTFSFGTTGGGAVTVKLTVTDDAVPPSSTSTSINLNVTAVTMSAVISATPSAPAPGDTVALSAAGSAAGSGRSIASYLWEITSGGSVASLSATGGPSVSLSAKAAGSVTVKLTITDNLGLQASSTKILTVATPSSGGGGGAWSPLWSLGLLLAALALPSRRQPRG